MKKIKVLVYDDEKNIRDSIKSKLNGKVISYKISEAKSDKDAIVKISGEHVDVLLVDIDMLKVNGIEQTGHIMKECPNIKILTLSMLNGTSYEIKKLEESKRGYILKNVADQQLDSAIQTLITNSTYQPRLNVVGKR